MGLTVDILLLFLIYDQSYVIDSAKVDFHSVISTFCLNNGFKYVIFINNKCKNSSSLTKINSKGVKGELVQVARWKKLFTDRNFVAKYSQEVLHFDHEVTYYLQSINDSGQSTQN